MKRLILIFVFCGLLLPSAYGEDKSESKWEYSTKKLGEEPLKEKIDGYALFKFSMTLGKVKKLDDRIKIHTNTSFHLSQKEVMELDDIGPCAYEGVKSCGRFASSVLGETVEIDLRACVS